MLSLIILSLAVLFFFKYFNFFAASFFRPGMVIDVILPVGISFYTFTAIGCYVDVLRGESPPPPTFSSALLLIAFWPHLAAGPILRSRNILTYADTPEPLTVANFQLSLMLIASGLVKKLLLADNIGSYVNWNIDYGVANLRILDAWSVLIGFAAQIYADFSGYSDMAIGFALLLGFRLPANFNYPYLATSITDFWRRWHISLSTWFRDYVYYPLGGNRHGLLRACLSILIVFLLSGVWHGAGVGFILWGAAHGTLLALEKIFYKPYMRVPAFIRWCITVFAVLLLWSFFRLPADQAALLIERLFAFSTFSLVTQAPYIQFPIWIFASLLVLDHALRPYRVNTEGFPELAARPLGMTAVSALLPLAILLFGKDLPFIYFQF
ncbi:MAG: MBOAT family protein [Leptospirales bacterium]|nr:MBOAT family protein [Leptospirales bacterium]